MALWQSAWLPQHLRKSSFYILTFFLLSSIVLFVTTYDRFWTLQLGHLQQWVDGDNHDRSIRDLSSTLHPENHNRRAPTTVTHFWNITKGYRSPDGVRKLVYLVNGQFPGPTIEARSGDILEIHVSNHLQDEGVAIHWHGLKMKGANNMDGVVGITQDAIPAGHDFTYKFQLSEIQAGTFWYHSHFELQRSDGLYGGLVIHRPVLSGVAEPEKYLYEHEQLLLIGDWYHRPATEVQASYLTYTSSGHEPVPDSLLMNGLGLFDCSMAVLARPVECEHVQQPSLSLEHGQTRLRIVNVGAMAGFNISLPNGHMEVIEIDGGNAIIPVRAAEVGVLHPGERFDVLLHHADVKNLSIILNPELFTMQNPALTTTQTFPVISQSHPTTQSSNVELPNFHLETEKISIFDLSMARSNEPQYPSMPQTANQTVLIYTHIELLAHYDHVPRGYMNRTHWEPQSPALLTLPRDKWDENQFVPEVIGNGEWVDIIINNIDKDAGHPFHLHGYDFQVLTRHAFPRRAGYRTYNPFDLPSDAEVMYPKPNLIDAPVKDTVHVPRRGYVILRIKAENLGLWFLHCHVLWHSGGGMGMSLLVV